MKMKIVLAAIGLAAFTAIHASAQDADHTWSKTYQVSAKPTFTLETGDTALDVRSCGECHEIRIHVEVVGRKLSDYRLEESQSGDQVHFLFKELPHMGVHIGWHNERTRVTVETPVQLVLDARTSDGGVTLNGLQGEIGLTTGDGDVTIDHVSGNLRIKTGDGRVNINDASGALDARTSDGNLNVDGAFHVLTLHTSDGTLDLNLREGTKLTEASAIQSSDGSVTVRLPHDFAADLNVHTSDGHVDCSLPVTMNHFHSNGGESHDLQGQINGGGTPLTIHTSDGNVKIEAL
jgi:hypothetical protein